jgi:hypothetical protein
MPLFRTGRLRLHLALYVGINRVERSRPTRRHGKSEVLQPAGGRCEPRMRSQGRAVDEVPE